MKASTLRVAEALCIHAGWHYTATRIQDRRPDYVLWGHGYWRTTDVSDSLAGGSGEGGWPATSDPRYGGGMSFTLGTWNHAADLSHGLVPHANNTASIAAQPPAVQLLAALLIRAEDGDWHEWPQTSRACGLR